MTNTARKLHKEKLVAEGAVGILHGAHDATEEAICKACLNLSCTDLPLYSHAFLRKHISCHHPTATANCQHVSNSINYSKCDQL